MKLFGIQQLECLQGRDFFEAETHIYILDPPSNHKKVVYPIILLVIAIFMGTWRF